MKSITKKIISLLCVAFLAVSAFAGCGDNSTGSNSGNNGTNQSGNVNLEDYRGTKVVYATWERSEGIDINKAINNFKNKYGITVEVKTVAQRGYVESIIAMINSGEAPDVIKDADFYPGWVNIAQPLENAKIDLTSSQWDQRYLSLTEYEGKHYGIASTNFGQNFYMLYYNKTLLNNKGIRTPHDYQKIGQWNFDAFENLMKQVVQVCGKGYYGAYIDNYGSLLYPCFGTDVFKFENGKFTTGVTDDNFIKIASYISKWGAQGWLATDRNSFVDGKVAMAITSDYGLRNSGHWREMNKKDLAFIEIPKMGDVEPSIAGSWQGYGICKGAKNPVAGGIFLTWYLNEDNHDIINEYISEEAYSFRAQYCQNYDNKFLNVRSGVLTALGWGDRPNYYYITFYNTDATQISGLLRTYQNTLKANAEKLTEEYETSLSKLK